MSKIKRRTFVVDRHFQIGLAMRLVVYWTCTWLVVLSIPVLVCIFNGAMSFSELVGSVIGDFWFPMLISAMLLPILAFDCIRFSNRVAGPIYKLRRVMQQLAEKKEVGPVSFRDGDFCQELAADFQRLIGQFQSNGNANQEDPVDYQTTPQPVKGQTTA